MKNRILLGFVAIVLVIGLVIGGCAKPAPAPPTAPPPAEVIELNYAFSEPATATSFKTIGKNFVDEIEKRTEGRVKITMYPEETLLKGFDAYEGVLDGITDIVSCPTVFQPGRFPVFSILEMTSFPSAVIGSQIANDWYNKWKPEEFADVHPLYFHQTTDAHLLSTVPIRTLEELQGLEIRAVGGTADIIKLLGAVPISVPYGEIYEVLSKGIVVAVATGEDAMTDMALYEIVDYVILAYLSGTPFYEVMNLDTWNSLPSDIQDIFTKVSQESIVPAGQAWDDVAYKAMGFSVKEAGVECIRLSPEEYERWHDLFETPLYDAWVEDMDAMGLPGKEMHDELNRLIKKY